MGLHCSDVIVGTIAFTQPFIHAQMKGNIKAPRHWHLCREFTDDRWTPRTKASKWKMCPFDDVIMDTVFSLFGSGVKLQKQPIYGTKVYDDNVTKLIVKRPFLFHAALCLWWCRGHLGTDSMLHKTSFRKISQCLEVARPGVLMLISVWNLAGAC